MHNRISPIVSKMSFMVGLFESVSKQGPHKLHLVAVSLRLCKFEQSALIFFFNAAIPLSHGRRLNLCTYLLHSPPTF